MDKIKSVFLLTITTQQNKTPHPPIIKTMKQDIIKITTCTIIAQLVMLIILYSFDCIRVPGERERIEALKQDSVHLVEKYKMYEKAFLRSNTQLIKMKEEYGN